MNAKDKVNGTLAPQEVSLDVLREKYAKGDERTIADVRAPGARARARRAPAPHPAPFEPRVM
ncbi:hypothetical protein, partial [Massilia sp. AB1]|uniref:hypothetical protein n=1 Tax=Massilia sp. AB1 TaxID=2823371 RepID=UPI001B83EF8E